MTHSSPSRSRRKLVFLGLGISSVLLILNAMFDDGVSPRSTVPLPKTPIEVVRVHRATDPDHRSGEIEEETRELSESIRLHVADEGGRDLADCTVAWLEPGLRSHAIPRSRICATTDSLGRATIPVLEERVAVLAIVRRDLQVAYCPIDGPGVYEVTLRRGHDVTITVVDPLRAPIRGATVMLSHVEAPYTAWKYCAAHGDDQDLVLPGSDPRTAIFQARTDEGGRATIRGLDELRYSLTVLKRGYALAGGDSQILMIDTQVRESASVMLTPLYAFVLSFPGSDLRGCRWSSREAAVDPVTRSLEIRRARSDIAARLPDADYVGLFFPCNEFFERVKRENLESRHRIGLEAEFWKRGSLRFEVDAAPVGDVGVSSFDTSSVDSSAYRGNGMKESWLTVVIANPDGKLIDTDEIEVQSSADQFDSWPIETGRRITLTGGDAHWRIRAPRNRMLDGLLGRRSVELKPGDDRVERITLDEAVHEVVLKFDLGGAREGLPRVGCFISGPGKGRSYFAYPKVQRVWLPNGVYQIECQCKGVPSTIREFVVRESGTTVAISLLD